MGPQVELAVKIAPIGISLVAVVFSIISFLATRRNSRIQTALALHSKLFEKYEDFAVVYLTELSRDRYRYFNSTTSGSTNYVGSEDEAKIDLFLERLNFVCFWLQPYWLRRKEERLFRKYIEKIYRSPFFQQYFSFLDDEDLGEGHFEFIHLYAGKRLKLPRPHVPYATTPEELAEMKSTAPSARLTHT